MGTLDQMRRGILLFVLVLVGAALAATVARADVNTTTPTDTTTTETTDTTTTATTTTETTTTSTTTTTSSPKYAPLAVSALPKGCVGAGFAAVANPDGSVGALGLGYHALGASDYPRTRPFLTFDSGAVTGSSCRSARVLLANVSLFAGAVAAKAVSATDGNGKVIGLTLRGSHVNLRAGETIAVGSWGLLTRAAKSGRLSAPLALRFVHTHRSVPAGTTIYIGFAATALPRPHVVTPPPPSHNHHHHPHAHPKHPKPRVPQPLAATPKLGISATHYVFPIDAGASYIDTYGAGRNDIYDGWHHGDDLFAPVGTPVVAVTDGKLSLVGWNALGGWRLWLTDAKGNSFYYAHLAGYSRYILHHRTVKAGQVVGFLGRTGDAFPTPPHLHFEIHPHQFVKLGYDGAVDPTTYLQNWAVETLPASKIPAAARLRAPAGTPSQEAAVVWGELLKARHLMPDGQPLVARTPSVRRPFPSSQDPAFVDARRLASSRLDGDTQSPASPWPSVVLGLTLASLAYVGLFAFVRRRRSA